MLSAHLAFIVCCELGMSALWILYNSEGITDPWGIPAEVGRVADNLFYRREKYLDVKKDCRFRKRLYVL